MSEETAKVTGGPVLAMYDVRAKQNYIYRTKKLKEIQGASAIIRDVFNNHLYDEARKYRNECNSYQGNPDDAAIYNYKDEGCDQLFNYKEFKDRMDNTDNQYIGEVVYDGGGNFIVLYKNAGICEEVSYRFGRRLLVEAPGLNILCTYVGDLDPNNYNNTDYDKDNVSQTPGDYQRLYNEHRKNENQESIVVPYGTLPIVQADYISSMPLTKKVKRVKSDRPDKVTSETYAKYKKFYKEYCSKNSADDSGEASGGTVEFDEKILDNLVTEKGRESLLAVIYIDGNNMGAKVQSLLNNKTTYDDCVNELRDFSKYIQKMCVDEQTEKIDNILKKRLRDDLRKEIDRKRKDLGLEPVTDDEAEKEIGEKIKTRRLVVAAGDEITIICNARYAYEIAKAYLMDIHNTTSKVIEEMKQKGDSSRERFITSCAGITIFHSHTPFADAYRIAEECCESGKKKMKDLNIQNACFLDYHYCQGAIGTSLEDIREHEETTDCSLPWLIVDCGNHAASHNLCSINDIEGLEKDLNELGRSNVKGLAEKAGDGLASLEMEIKRILAHREDRASGLNILGKYVTGAFNKYEKEKYRKLIFDMVNVYDLWFTND